MPIGEQASPPSAKAAIPLSGDGVRLLTGRMARGEDTAFAEFFDLYFHRLYAYLLVVASGNDAEARELVQQTMLRVAKHVRPFDSEAVFWGWLTVLARSCALDERRKSRRYWNLLTNFVHRREAERAPGPEFSLSEALAENLGRLEGEERAVLELKYLEGLSVRELAVRLATTEKAVESRLTRSREKLRRLCFADSNRTQS